MLKYQQQKIRGTFIFVPIKKQKTKSEDSFLFFCLAIDMSQMIRSKSKN